VTHQAHLEHLPHSVYRCYDADGVLLYIGCSYQVEKRLKWHTTSSAHWFQHVADVKVQQYANRSEGLAAELEAIITEEPVFNVKGVSSWSIQWSRVRAYEKALKDKAERARRFFPWERAVFARHAGGVVNVVAFLIFAAVVLGGFLRWGCQR
jgi:excinuclease UvrABC nuclease subunit